ncbi:hypothetical protein ACQPZJ_35340 [Actinoplanes sp. CA-054009]
MLTLDDPYPHTLELAASGDRALIAPARAALLRLVADDEWHHAGYPARILAGA